MQAFGQRIQHTGPVRRKFRQRLDGLQQGRAITIAQGLQQRSNPGTVDTAEHAGHDIGAQLAAGIGDGLVQQGQTIAHRAISGAGQLGNRLVVGSNLFSGKDFAHLPADLRMIQPLEVELQAAAEHGHRQLLRVGGGQQELHMRRRLFQGLEQRIERRLGQHVHLVDQVHLVVAAAGHVLRVLDHLSHIVHTGIGSGIDFQQVDIAPGIDIPAGGAFTTGVGTGAALAIERLGKDARDRGLAHPAGACEQKGMVHPAGVQRIGQRTHHMLLADQFGKTLGAPLAGQNEIGHRLEE